MGALTVSQRRKSWTGELFSSDAWWQLRPERVRFESYIVICLALDSDVNIQVFCNVLFLFSCHCWLFLCISSVNYWNQNIFSYSRWQLPKLCEKEFVTQKNTLICCYIQWRYNSVYWCRGHQAVSAGEFCPKETSGKGRGRERGREKRNTHLPSIKSL